MQENNKLASAKIVDYPSQSESLHPMAGMKRIHTLDGTERQFELSEAARLSHELARRSAQPAQKRKSVEKRLISWWKRWNQRNPGDVSRGTTEQNHGI